MSHPAAILHDGGGGGGGGGDDDDDDDDDCRRDNQSSPLEPLLGRVVVGPPLRLDPGYRVVIGPIVSETNVRRRRRRRRRQSMRRGRSRRVLLRGQRAADTTDVVHGGRALHLRRSAFRPRFGRGAVRYELPIGCDNERQLTCERGDVVEDGAGVARIVAVFVEVETDASGAGAIGGRFRVVGVH